MGTGGAGCRWVETGCLMWRTHIFTSNGVTDAEAPLTNVSLTNRTKYSSTKYIQLLGWFSCYVFFFIKSLEEVDPTQP